MLKSFSRFGLVRNLLNMSDPPSLETDPGSSTSTNTNTQSSNRLDLLQTTFHSEDSVIHTTEERELEEQHLKNAEHLFRLFVGWVPKGYTESDLQPLFDRCGEVKDLIILKDKVTGQPRGCAFVSYATKQEAEIAIAKLDRQVQLPGAMSPLEVRFARSHQYVQAGAGPEDNRQLFFARAPVTANEDAIRALFGEYGDVLEVNLFRERRTHISKGCGFVTMGSRDQAVKAMEAMDEKHVLEGSVTPLAVKWADPELQVKKRRAVEDSNAENRMLFFAKVLRSATEEEVKQLFQKHGRVYDVNLFRAFQGAPTTKGCGLVTMGNHEEAIAAIEALDNKYVWDGMDSPMVVKWMDAALQKRRREEHLAAMRSGLIPSMGMGPDVWMPGPSHSLLSPLMKTRLELPSELPPPGCNADAMKLFVGNIPKHYTEERLRPFFESVGKVIELVIVRDKFTHESKGSAFVWYATRAQAERAILQFNVRHVLPDPTGEQDRPLVVRKANSRKNSTHMMHMPALDPALMMGAHMDMPLHVTPMMASHFSGSHLDSGLVDSGSVGLDDALFPGMQQSLLSTQSSGTGYYGKGGITSQSVNTLTMGLENMSMSGDGLSASSNITHSYQSNVAQPVVSLGGVPEATAMGPSHPEIQYVPMTPSNPVGPSPGADIPHQMTLTMHMNSAQMNALNSHLFSIQTMSGAQLRAAPGAPGLFYLMISGSENQVTSAKTLVGAVLTPAGINTGMM